MSALAIFSYTPLPGKLADVLEALSNVVRLARTHEPKVTMWMTTHGGDSTHNVQVVQAYDSLPAALANYDQIMDDPAARAAIRNVPPLATSQPRISLARGMPGYDTPIAPAGGAPRAAFLYVAAVHPEMLDVQGRVHAMSERHGLSHSAAIRLVAGASPAVVMAFHMAPTMAALGAGIEGIGTDPEYLSLSAKYGAGLGNIIMKEIVVD
jgi:hypothetical protein